MYTLIKFCQKYYDIPTWVKKLAFTINCLIITNVHYETYCLLFATTVFLNQLKQEIVNFVEKHCKWQTIYSPYYSFLKFLKVLVFPLI